MSDDLETGAPVVELADFVEPPRSGFSDRVHNSINRRLLASDLANYAWLAPIRILTEYIDMLFSLLDGRSQKKERAEK